MSTLSNSVEGTTSSISSADEEEHAEQQIERKKKKKNRENDENVERKTRKKRRKRTIEERANNTNNDDDEDINNNKLLSLKEENIKNEDKNEEIIKEEKEINEETKEEQITASAVDVFSSEWIADPEKRREVQLAILKEVISTCKKEDINNYNERGETLLMRAAALRNPELVSELLKREANPNIQNKISKESALHFAVGEGNLEITKLLIDNGADVSLIDLMGFNCLHVACFCSSLKGKEAEEMFQILVENGIPIDAPDSTRKSFSPIHFLCSIAHAGEYDDSGDQDHVLELVKMICVKLNADPCVRNSSSMLPLHLSAERGHERVCEFLLSRISLSFSESEFIDIINSQDTAGNSPLHLAILKKREPVIALFRNYPFNWEIPNANGETPNQLYDKLVEGKQSKHDSSICNILQMTLNH